jgi:Transglutaminase-like superfamily
VYFLRASARQQRAARYAVDEPPRASARLLLILQAYFELIRCGIRLRRSDFAGLHQSIRILQDVGTSPRIYLVEQVCEAIDVAATWYWKQVLCLQRAAATTRLLKRFGIPARMVIGTQLMPFKAHAWVEVNGRVVNDKSYVREIYDVLDVC